ncbi:MAG: metallophosphoesterase [Gammaproteobacteria bacterium]|nr:metallophosphoesterase [Gammaproteobacteria bacterium]
MDQAEREAEASRLCAHFGGRVSRLHVRQRLGLEADKAARVFGQGLNWFHPENWYALHRLLELGLKAAGLYRRGLRNALDIRCRRHVVFSPRLPSVFAGYTLLQLSDLHMDMHPDFPHALAEAVRDLDYDACVLTGDFRFRTAGDWEPALDGLRRLRLHLKDPIYAILGNHDSLSMVPAMEASGLRVLVNETAYLSRGGERLALVGIDDAHYYRVDNLDKACVDLDFERFCILLSHSPELYRQAAHAGFDLMLAGHSHAGQICLPGGMPLMLNANCPRRYARGPWRYHGLQGYTSAGCGSSIVPLRYACPPEVTLHRLLPQ